MGTSVEGLSFGLVIENDGAESLSVDSAILLENFLSEMSHYCSPGRLARFYHCIIIAE